MRAVAVILFFAIGSMACKSGDKKATENDITQGNDITKKPVAQQGDPAIPAADPESFTTIQWLDSTYLDLGEQKEGKEVEISFRFKNTGTKNLVIENVSAQCGCTIPEKPEKPFAPGEEGFIKAKFNGAGHDETRKQVYVRANISPDGNDTLTFRAFLVK